VSITNWGAARKKHISPISEFGRYNLSMQTLGMLGPENTIESRCPD
jgi:hypothetical protein